MKLQDKNYVLKVSLNKRNTQSDSRSVPQYCLSLSILLISIALTACGSSNNNNSQAVAPDCQSLVNDPMCTDDVVPPANDGTDSDSNSQVNSSLNDIPPDIEGGRYYLNSNNSAILTGPVFGSGDIDNQSVAKSLRFSVEDSASGLRLIELRAIDYGRGATNLLGVVENTGSEFECDSAIKGLVVYSSTGELLSNTTAVDPITVVGVVGSEDRPGVFRSENSRCISPGSLAYFQKSAGGGVQFSEVAEARAESFSRVNRSERFLTQASVVPISYTPAEFGVNVRIVNNHNLPVRVLEVNGFALNASNNAIGTGSVFFNETLEPGQEATITPPLLLRFQGSASRMRVVIEYRIVDNM